MARCQQDASLARSPASCTTIDVIRRLIDQAGIHRSSPKVRSARQRRRATDQHLTEQATRLGFASLQTYLADRVTRQAWTLTQVASELGTDPETVRDRLDRCGLRRTRQTPCAAGWQPSGRPAQPGARAGTAGGPAGSAWARDLQGYLRVRGLEQGWPVRRMRAELRVDPAWLRQQMTELGIP